MKPSTFSLTESAFPKEAVTAQAKRFLNADPSFKYETCLKELFYGYEKLSFSERSERIQCTFEKFLPTSFDAFKDTLLKALPKPLPTDRLEGFENFIIMPLSEMVALRSEGHFDEGMELLKTMTQCFSAEGAIRTFIERDQDRAFSFLKEWIFNSNSHVRRLCTEGTRPHLPLYRGLPSLIKDPTPIFELLQHFKEEPSETVRRSVANNLNDITKEHPEEVLDFLTPWSVECTKETRRLIHHALRTLLKEGHPRALFLLGYFPPQGIEISHVSHPSKLIFPDTFEISFQLYNSTDTPFEMMIDYGIFYPKRNGESSKKVFKGAKKSLLPHTTLKLSLRCAFRPMSTRKHYAGEHTVHLYINGISLYSGVFEVEIL